MNCLSCIAFFSLLDLYLNFVSSSLPSPSKKGTVLGQLLTRSNFCDGPVSAQQSHSHGTVRFRFKCITHSSISVISTNLSETAGSKNSSPTRRKSTTSSSPVVKSDSTWRVEHKFWMEKTASLSKCHLQTAVLRRVQSPNNSWWLNL